MHSVEKSAKTLDEAVRLALYELDCSEEQVNIEVLEEPGKRLFGFLGAKEARVRVTKKEAAGREPAANAGTAGEKEEFSPKNVGEAAADLEESPAEEELLNRDKTARFLKEATGFMGIEAHVQRKEDDESIRYELSGPHMGSIIGRRGDTLDALQYLANIIANKGKEESRKRILLDAEDYRRRREETLIRLAQRLAGRVKRTGRKVVLEPMSPMERRVIHTALQDDPEVKTLSEGEEPYRRLVISPTEGEGSRGYGRRGGYDHGNSGYNAKNSRGKSDWREGDQKRYGEGYVHVNGGSRPVRRSFSDWEEEKDSRGKTAEGAEGYGQDSAAQDQQ